MTFQSARLVAGRANDGAAVRTLDDERQHPFREELLDRVDRALDEPLALARSEAHLQRAALAFVHDLRVQAVRGERLREVAPDAAPRNVDLDRLGH